MQLEFEKIRSLLNEKCKSEYGKSRSDDLRIHTKKEFIEKELRQTHEYKQLIQNSIYFPNDYVLNLLRELRLLEIEDSLLSGEEVLSGRVR